MTKTCLIKGSYSFNILAFIILTINHSWVYKHNIGMLCPH